MRNLVRRQPNRCHAAARTGAPGAFTLIEALIAMAIIAIVLPLAMQGISLATRLGADARHRSEAAELAKGKLDELAITGAWRTDPLSGEFGADWPAYRWVATSTPWSSGTMNELTVTVIWNQGQREHSIVMGTLVNPSN